MKYYQVGVVDYRPRIDINGTADYSEPYILGDTIPIIISFIKESSLSEHVTTHQVYWVENTVEDLKPGDPIIFNINTKEIYKITADPRGVGIFEKET